MQPVRSGRGEYDSLVVRTDYSDEQPWKAVKAALLAPQGSDDYEPSVHFLDDPSWAGAGVDVMLEAVSLFKPGAGLGQLG